MNYDNFRNVKPYEELEFRDDFMFGKVMEDIELCREVLECLLQHPVGELTIPESQKEFRYSEKGKPIRLDIYSCDDDTVYDTEMQNLNHRSVEALELPKRSRFYQSSIDTDFMNKNYSYKRLPESVILFICTFDPFGKGLSRYTFQEKCAEDEAISLNDGTTKIFFNCRYGGNDIPDDLRRFYDYIETGKADSVLTKQLAKAVSDARKREEWRSAYMKEISLLIDAREEGIAQGIERGIAQGIEQGIKQGMEQGMERGIKQGMELGVKKEQANTEAERLRADKAEALVEKYREKYGALT